MQKIAHFISPFILSPLHIKESNEEKPPVVPKLVHTKICSLTKIFNSAFSIKIRPLLDKVKQVALFILRATVSILLYWVNPSLFAIGFIAGIIFDDSVRGAIQKIKNVWKTQKLTGTLFGTLACAISMPVSIATASVLWSAHLGSLMSSEAQRILKMHPSLDEMTQMNLAVESY